MAYHPSLFLSLNETGDAETDRLSERLQSLANVTRTVGGIAALIHTLRRTSQEPDILFIELDGDPTGILNALDMLKEHVPSTCSVYGFGRLNDIGFLRSLLAIGFIDYFVSPFQATSLDEIAHVIAKRDTGHEGKVIGFVGLAGGVGTSLVALNFAQFLAERSVADVTLCHPQPAPYNTQFDRYLFEAPDKDQIAHPNLIKPDPTLRDEGTAPDTEPRQDRIGTYRVKGHVVLVDIGTQLSQREMLSQCDHIIVIGEPDYRSLLNVKPLNAFLSSHYPFAERHFALTKIGLEERIEFSRREVQSLIDDQPVMLYKYDLETIAAALSKPVPLLPATLLDDQYAFEILSKRCRIILKPLPDERQARFGAFASLSALLAKWKMANG